MGWITSVKEQLKISRSSVTQPLHLLYSVQYEWMRKIKYKAQNKLCVRLDWPYYGGSQACLMSGIEVTSCLWLLIFILKLLMYSNNFDWNSQHLYTIWKEGKCVACDWCVFELWHAYHMFFVLHLQLELLSFLCT